jgi:hypothetical protein
VDGNLYEGQWYNNKKHGYGTFFLNTYGEKYEGEFQDGEKHGKGVYYFCKTK